MRQLVSNRLVVAAAITALCLSVVSGPVAFAADDDAKQQAGVYTQSASRTDDNGTDSATNPPPRFDRRNRTDDLDEMRPERAGTRDRSDREGAVRGTARQGNDLAVSTTGRERNGANASATTGGDKLWWWWWFHNGDEGDGEDDEEDDDEEDDQEDDDKDTDTDDKSPH